MITSTADPNLDPITMHVLRRRLEAVTDEITLALVRTSRSVGVVYEYDCSAGICDEKGNVLTSGLVGYGHLPAVSICLTEFVIPRFEGNINPGDMFIMNNPRDGGMHLNDIYLMKPVFAEARRIAWTAVVVHHVDVGGRTPGSIASDSTEIFQEGLQIPLCKLYSAEAENSVVLDFIERNVRMPDVTLADIQAQISACNTGARRLEAVADEYGVERFCAYVDGLLDYSESVTRSAISSWPDGSYEASDYLDEDSISEDPVLFHVTVTIQGDEIAFDYTGSSPQVAGSMNCGIPELHWWTYIALIFAMGPDLDIPYNSGFWRPVKIFAPEGTIVNALHPAARAARGISTRRILEASTRALALALPGTLPACPHGDVAFSRLSHTPSGGGIEIHSEMVWGVPGALPTHDGADGLATSSIGDSNVPVEILEQLAPLLVRRYEFVADTAGPGRFRGGLAICREWEVLAPEMRVVFRSDRRRFPPWGLEGGGEGAPSTLTLKSGAEEKVLPSKINRLLKRGDVLYYSSAGGGGYGDPLERDPEAVLSDWINEKITLTHAERVYGVVIDEATRSVVSRKTLALRERIRVGR